MVLITFLAICSTSTAQTKYTQGTDIHLLGIGAVYIDDNNISETLTRLAEDFAAVISEVDAQAEHDRWKPGIGPFEEEKQMEMLVEATEESPLGQYLLAEQAYPDNGQRCDIVVEQAGTQIPIEAKLLRFRYDNGSIDPASYARIFTPFPERRSSSLLTDAKKLHDSGFEPSGGLLGLYYEKEDEAYDRMDAETIAEKFRKDVGYWYDFTVETTKIARFDGLQHPHHQQGAIITWAIKDS